MVNTLLEVTNTYRTLAALFTLLLLLKLYVRIETGFPNLKPWEPTMLAVLLAVMFLASFRKQSSYVTKRVNANTAEVEPVNQENFR